MLDSEHSPMPVSLKKGQQELLAAMGDSHHEHEISDHEMHWLTTRELANLCGFTIYKARYLLLDLADKGYVTVSDCDISNSLRWSPALTE